MMMSVIKNGLIAHDDEARALLSKLKIGALVDVDVLNPIHTKFHAKMMAAIAALAKASGMTEKAMRTKLLVLTGRFQMVPITPQKKVLVADSMSRSAMTETERETFWTELCEVVHSQLLPMVDDHTADEIRPMFDAKQTEETENESA
jgi:hypothetical protein